MTTTPNPTPEQAVAEALNDMWGGETHDGSPWSPEGNEVITIADKLRAHGLLSEGAPSEEQVERAARALCAADNPGVSAEYAWSVQFAEGWADYRAEARAALTAAGVAPQEPTTADLEPVILAAEVAWRGHGRTEPLARAIARAVTEHLRGSDE